MTNKNSIYPRDGVELVEKNQERKAWKTRIYRRSGKKFTTPDNSLWRVLWRDVARWSEPISELYRAKIFLYLA